MRDEAVCILQEPIWAACNLGQTWPQIWSNLVAGTSNLEPAHDHLPRVRGEIRVGATALANGSYWERGRRLARATADVVIGSTRALHGKHADIRSVTLIATSHGDPGPSAACAEATLGFHADWEQVYPILSDAISAGIRDAVGRFSHVYTVGAACASGVVALDLGALMLEFDQADLVYVVALDALSRVAYTGFRQAVAMTRNTARPFDIDRDGTMLGEAAVVFAMSLARTARALRLQPAAVIEASAQQCDASHLVEPSATGVMKTISKALERAGRQPHELAAVYWHGTATRQNDDAEASAARAIFGATVPPGTSTKGALGHCMGASGAINVLAACQSLKEARIPATAGLRTAEVGSLSIVHGAPAQIGPGPILVNSLGFGGINACAIFGSAAGV